MKFEHFALNVPDVHAHVQWYVQHLGFTVARKVEGVPYMHFLADDTGRIIVELYSNPKAAYPNYGAADPLLFHLALVAPDAKAESTRLQQAGAKLVIEQPQADGSLLIFVRDPWGVPLQLCQRAKPFPMP
jgi:glyoxylase I family protein